MHIRFICIGKDMICVKTRYRIITILQEKYYLYFGHFYNIKMSCFSLYFFEGCSELDSVAKLGGGLGWELIYFTVRT